MHTLDFESSMHIIFMHRGLNRNLLSCQNKEVNYSFVVQRCCRSDEYRYDTPRPYYARAVPGVIKVGTVRAVGNMARAAAAGPQMRFRP